MITSKISSDGQTTIPVEVRQKLGIGAGDVLAYELDEGGVRLRKGRGAGDGWAASIAATLAEEWDSPEDDETFADLQR